MLIENTLFGEVNKVKKAIDRLKAFEPKEGYYLAFSGGKDSQCIYHLAKESKVKFDAHYNITNLDPPELIQFVKKEYPDVKPDMPKETMWRLIVKKGPPTRLNRFCCKSQKEHGGEGRICITGVRWEESTSRASNRNAFEVFTPKKEDAMLFNDNEDGRRLFETCIKKGKRIVNPIIDWNESDVWDYLNSRGIKHCCLYDEGFHRLGCIGCPMGRTQQIEKQFERWPKYKQSFLRAFGRMIERRKERGLREIWETPEDVMEWWLYGTVKKVPVMENQIDIMNLDEVI